MMHLLAFRGKADLFNEIASFFFKGNEEAFLKVKAYPKMSKFAGYTNTLSLFVSSDLIMLPEICLTLVVCELLFTRVHVL